MIVLLKIIWNILKDNEKENVIKLFVKVMKSDVKLIED